MKKQLFLTLAICFYFASGFGQQFSFQMYFSDAIGNGDTITLGYDPAATTGIDAAFGETDILPIPLDTNLDVRITSPWYTSSYPVIFSTKKQIVYYDCTYNNWSIQPINIFTHHWPVTVSWDPNLFQSPCLNGSVFTSVSPGGWWDVTCPSNLFKAELANGMTRTFTNNFELGNFGYLNGAGDSIPVFWQAFGDSTLITLSVPDLHTTEATLKVFPNPTTNILNLTISDNFGSIVSVEVCTILGRKLLSYSSAGGVDLSTLPSGVYFVFVMNDKGEKIKGITVKI